MTLCQIRVRNIDIDSDTTSDYYYYSIILLVLYIIMKNINNKFLDTKLGIYSFYNNNNNNKN